MNVQAKRETEGGVRCAQCGQGLDVLRAPQVRFSEIATYFFCSKEHSDAFSFTQESLSPATPTNQEQDGVRVLVSSMPPAPHPGARVPPEHSALEKAKELLAERAKQSALRNIQPGDAPNLLNPKLDSPNPLLLPFETPYEESFSKEDVDGPLPLSNAVDEADEAEVRDSLLPAFGVGRTEAESQKGLPLEQSLAWLPVALSAIAAALSIAGDEDFWPIVATTVILALSVTWGQASLKAWDKSASERCDQLRDRLEQTARRVTSLGTEVVPSDELRPGEEILIKAGEWITADGTLSEGRALVRPWYGCREDIEVEPGSRLTAGGQVRSGECRMTCTKAGRDRAFAPLVSRDVPRIDHQTFASRLARLLSGPIAPVAAAGAASLVWLEGGGYSTVLSVFAAAWGALSHPVARTLPAIMARKWLMRAARHGISFAHGELLDLGGHVTTAVFCARGTVLHGQPEVAEVHPLRDASESEILSLAAGAESVVHHPVAAAVLRAADVRKTNVDTCRSHNPYPGSGVVCVSSKGDLIVLGSRELLLRERISIAMAEETLRSLESRGLSSLLLAKNNHLVGVLALQDSLRAGAKASVQLLLDEGIEPVLLSGDSRITTEAVAHALAIEHVRPEVAAGGRAAEVRSLIDAGSFVSVIGTSPRDDSALGAAPVPIVLEGASVRFRDATKRHERCIGLVGDQILTAPLALLICRRIRHAGAVACTTSFFPAFLGSASVASQLVPVYVAPLLATAAAVLAAWLCLRDGPQVKSLRPEQGL